ILVLAGDSGTVLEGSALLAVYALGLAVPFLIAAALFVPAMGVFRWIRDHYVVIQLVSGAVLVALGLLLFFGRFWWLQVYLNRFFRAIGLA
nr:cytochrome c biogenesis protein CcdA [Actinomycetota bacterium]